MKRNVFAFAILFAIGNSVFAQDSIVDRFRHDERLQDSLIAVIVADHELMSKLVDRIIENPGQHKMLIQRLTRLLGEKETAPKAKGHTHEEMMSPYAGEQKIEIKALSEAEVKGLLGGEGLGLAMSAELNHYPGPKHVLDMAEQLQLKAEQRSLIQRSYDTMHEQAVELGKRLVDRERSLDREFASKTISNTDLQRLTREIARLQGELRNVHLAAHLETRSVLSQAQIDSYDRLRGY